jgi:preprotein translocase subunit SecF
VELFKNTNIDFLKLRPYTVGLTTILVIASIVSIVAKGGLRYGLDFRGGVLVYVKFRQKPPIEQVRKAIESKVQGEVTVQEALTTNEVIVGTEMSNEKTLELQRGAIDQALRENFGSTGNLMDLNNANLAGLTDRLRSANAPMTDDQLQQVAKNILDYRDKQKNGIIDSVDELSKVSGVTPELMNILKAQTGLGSYNIRSIEIVGPKAGEELRRQAVLATMYALAGMLVYIAFRFEFVSGVAAVIATIHDVIITLGFFSWTNREINLNVIAALLTLIGYSMNDTIVVFDRIRENLNISKKGSFYDLVNASVNQTLSRTVLTAGLTLLSTLALFFLGGEVLNGIAFALIIGIIVGTYSSIFVASAIVAWWHEYSEKRRRTPAVASAKPAR